MLELFNNGTEYTTADTNLLQFLMDETLLLKIFH